MTGRIVTVASLLLIAAVSPSSGQQPNNQERAAFDHEAHRGLFPSCLTCHPGASQPDLAMSPPPTSCRTCHDGEIEQRVAYTPPTLSRPSNLRFDHSDHAVSVTNASGLPVRCVDCHAGTEAEWMSVQFANIDGCLNCHQESEEHLDVPDASCVQCHVPLTVANRLTYDDVATFATPSSHEYADFATSLHGPMARGPNGESVAASCATCHAREFCIICHVDAPEVNAIQSLSPDARSLAHRATLPVPISHNQHDFMVTHGTESLASPTDCLTCHTEENCTTCHVATPEVASLLHRAGPSRASGPSIARSSPQSHHASYRTSHASEASTIPATCAGCHARQDCLDCHRPDAAMGPGGYHEPGFLTRHPSAAYGRETTCTDCHNDRNFCASCHLSVGVTSATAGILGSGYHDAKRAFTLGHGVAARQSLETCITCHVERDCLACHSATGSRRFSPHGPGFDAERLRTRNPEMCMVCHIRIPNG